jgi:RNase P subunit RPR2
MKNKPFRSEIEQEIKDVFSSSPNPNQIKKLKTLCMSKNVKLGSYRKKFCKKCCTFFDSNNSEVRIKNGFKIVKCKNCDCLSRYKLK